MPLLVRLVLGVPPIPTVPVVGMSQNTSTWILGLTKPNYNAPRISPLRCETSHKSLQITLYHTRQSNCKCTCTKCAGTSPLPSARVTISHPSITSMLPDDNHLANGYASWQACIHQYLTPVSTFKWALLSLGVTFVD